MKKMVGCSNKKVEDFKKKLLLEIREQRKRLKKGCYSEQVKEWFGGNIQGLEKARLLAQEVFKDEKNT